VKGHAGGFTRIRDSRVVDEHVEAAELLADALRRGGDRSLICHVELERAGVSVDRLGRSLAALETARSDQHSEGVRREILCDLKTDSLIGPVTRATGLSCIVISFLLRRDEKRAGDCVGQTLWCDAIHLANTSSMEAHPRTHFMCS
jgi:hypothetical protein